MRQNSEFFVCELIRAPIGAAGFFLGYSLIANPLTDSFENETMSTWLFRNPIGLLTLLFFLYMYARLDGDRIGKNIVASCCNKTTNDAQERLLTHSETSDNKNSTALVKIINQDTTPQTFAALNKFKANPYLSIMSVTLSMPFTVLVGLETWLRKSPHINKVFQTLYASQAEKRPELWSEEFFKLVYLRAEDSIKALPASLFAVLPATPMGSYLVTGKGIRRNSEEKNTALDDAVDHCWELWALALLVILSTPRKKKLIPDTVPKLQYNAGQSYGALYSPKDSDDKNNQRSSGNAPEANL